MFTEAHRATTDQNKVVLVVNLAYISMNDAPD